MLSGVSVAVVALLVGTLLRPLLLGQAVESQQAAFTSSVSGGLLQQFTQQHNESLLWGTYRPGVLFGVKSRTFPEAVVAGLMWTSVFGDGKRVDGAQLRHTCEESDTTQGLLFGYSEHDGSSYGKQLITDPAHKLSLRTYFLKRSPHTWVMRVAGNSSRGKKVLYLYLGIDQEFADAGGSDAGSSLAVEHREEGEPMIITGRTPSLGTFKFIAVPGEGSAHQLPGGHQVLAWAAPRGTPIVKVKEALLHQLNNGADSSAGLKPSLLQASSAPTGSGATLMVLQVVVANAFEVDFVFHGGLASAGGGAEAVVGMAAPLSGAGLSSQLRERSSAFRARFEETFGLRGGGATEEEVGFAEAALSALLGGLGYFYGSSKVRAGKRDGVDQHVQTPPRPLFTAVPSRSFFPRGFLWDEGFHQLLVGRWDPAVARDAIAHWFGLMQADGWIPREQILGAEARSKVPEWAVVQHPTHANPPTFLLAIEALLEGARAESGGVDRPTAAWLEVLFPAVERWFLWFVGSQKGAVPRSFRWHGRDASDGKLNAMTLSSGLDDYPRASAVSDQERHVDLHSWVAFGAGVLARVGEQAGMPSSKVAEYHRMQMEVLSSLDGLHWDEKRKRYCDYGLHSNDGKYAPHVVVKCAARDGSQSVEHALPLEHYQQLQRGIQTRPPCPPEFPQFQFPLGDGQGGLLMKERFVPRKQELQFVDHTGYVSLFPLLLRLLPPDSPRLLQLLELLGDPARGLWSDFGLRSLASGDKMYLRENGPGDAPYWRGPIWINCNFLAVSALRHYAALAGPGQRRAEELLARLSRNLVRNMLENYRRTGYLWEQYNPQDGRGQRTHPFNGWSSLVVLIMA